MSKSSFLILLSISIIELKHELTFRIAIGNPDHRRRAWPFGGDAGPVDAVNNTMQNSQTQNDRLPAMQGGILTALPPDKIRPGDNGAGDIMSLYPPNKIHASCDLCEAGIARYDGYRHAPIGVKRVVCQKCQSSLGLPLREAEVFADMRD